MKKLRPLFLPLLLFLAAFALFAPSIRYALVSLDDSLFIVNNPIVYEGFSWSALGRAFTALHADHCMYTPLLWVSYLFDSLLFHASPFNPWGFHLTNVLLHAANAVLLYFILLSAVRRPWLAFFAAAFWALHPLRVESVAWVTERKDTLSTFFAFASILFYLKAWGRGRPARDSGPGAQPPPSTRHSSLVTRHCGYGMQCLALLAFAAGLLSKPMLVTLPFLFLLLDYWPLRRFTLRDAPRALPRLALGKWPYFLLVLLFSLLTYQLQDEAITSAPLSFRLIRIPVNYLFYLARTVWPVGLCPLFPGFPHSLPWVLSSVACLLGLAFVAFLLFRRAPGFPVGLLAFAGLLFPVSGIVFIGTVPVADRYSYVPSLGLCLALLAILDAYRPTRRAQLCIVNCALCFVLAALAAVTVRILPSWADSDAFARRAGQVVPGHPLLLRQRFSEAFFNRNDIPAARSAADIIWRTQSHAIPFSVLAKVLATSQTESSSAAIAFFEALPNPPVAEDDAMDALRLALAVLYTDTGDFDKATLHLDAAIAKAERNPKFAELDRSIAFWCHISQNRSDLAGQDALRIPSMDTEKLNSPENFLVPLAAMWNSGLRRQTLPHLLRLAGDAPRNAALLNNLAWLLATAPNSPAPPDEVLDIARQARDAAPRHPVIRDTFAVALAFAGRFDEAIEIETALADSLRASSAPAAPAHLSAIEKRIALFRDRIPFTENADAKLLFAP
jgi:tetratricopeptide (TPR) repeat protein